MFASTGKEHAPGYMFRLASKDLLVRGLAAGPEGDVLGNAGTNGCCRTRSRAVEGGSRLLRPYDGTVARTKRPSHSKAAQLAPPAGIPGGDFRHA